MRPPRTTGGWQRCAREDVTDDLAAQGEGALVDVGVQQGDGADGGSGYWISTRMLSHSSRPEAISNRRFSTGCRYLHDRQRSAAQLLASHQGDDTQRRPPAEGAVRVVNFGVGITQRGHDQRACGPQR